MFYFLPREGKHTQGVTETAPCSEDLKMVKIFCILCLSIVRDRVACTLHTVYTIICEYWQVQSHVSALHVFVNESVFGT